MSRSASAELDTRVDVLGVEVSPIDVPTALAHIDRWIARRAPHYVCVSGVHGVMECQRDPTLREIHNGAGLVTPDGMPLVWLCRSAGHRETERVYGPDLLLAACERSLATGARHFFYGGAEGVADLLAMRLAKRFPGLSVAGTYCPPFRPLTEEEDAAVVRTINESEADIVWVGLSTPKQERWMAAHVGRLRAPVLIGVGAAFDFHAGLKRQAPGWMQRSGLEWLYRLVQEPRRLGPRYLVNNPMFIASLMKRRLVGEQSPSDRATMAEPDEESDTQQPSSLESLRKWGSKGLWAIVDQGLFSVANFILNLLFARWLIPDDYGAFTVAYSVFLLVGALHSGLLIEPMLVFGPGQYSDRKDHYWGTLNVGNIAMSAVASGLLLLASAVVRFVGPPVLSQALLGSAMACPGILLLWLSRRACYVHLEPRLTVAPGIAYLVLALIGAWGLRAADRLSPFTGLVCIGVASAVGAAWLMRRLPMQLKRPPSADGFTLRVAAEHWEYGRWAVATALLVWIPGQIYYVLLPTWGGLEASGVLKAMTNLVMPILHPYAAVAVLLTPALVRARNSGHFDRVVVWGATAFAVGGAAYWVLLTMFREPIVAWIYGGAYAGHTDILLAVGLLPLAGAGVAMFGPALRALERPDLIFWAYLASTVFALTGGIGLIATSDAWGAAIALVLSSTVTSVVLLVILHRHRGASPTTSEADPAGDNATAVGS